MKFVIDEDLLYDESFSYTATTIDREREITISFRFFLDDHNRFEVRVYELTTLRLIYSATITLKKKIN